MHPMLIHLWDIQHFSLRCSKHTWVTHLIKCLFDIEVKSVFCHNLTFFCLKLNFLVFLDRFDVLISKMNFKKWKNIILMYFQVKKTLKNNLYHTPKHSVKPTWKLCEVSFITICNTSVQHSKCQLMLLLGPPDLKQISWVLKSIS
jgi:hypothetical protein